MKIVGIHHVTVAVRDLDAAAATFAKTFGARVDHMDAVPAFGVRAADLMLGDVTLQLASAAEPDNAFARFIERKGEGFYNLALEVEDLDAAVRELQRAGVRISEPVEGTPGVRSAFIAMAATHGLSIQLVESDQPSAVSDQAASSDDGAAAATAEDERTTKVLDLTPDEWSDVD